jgi:hypothetical protein
MNGSLSMAQKVLLALYRQSADGRRKVRYEDIVVQAFRDYPSDFQLKGYPEYPDSGDAVHKPLYDYRKKGMVSASNKMFSLTTYGLAEVSRLQAMEKGRPPSAGLGHRIEREARIELERIKHLEGFKLFIQGKHGDIIDSDLFEYLGVSVRTNRNDFIGRLEAVTAALDEASGVQENDPSLVAVAEFHKFMIERFAKEIRLKTTPSKPVKESTSGA